MKKWSIMGEGERKKGPFTFQELKEKKERNEITDSTLIWSEEFGEWIPYAEVLKQELLIKDTPVAAGEPESSVKFDEEEMAKKERSARPWIRFWARMIDYNLFAICLGIFFGIGYAYFPLLRYTLLTIFGVLFLWVWIESLLLSTWGYTPGKWLFNIKVRRNDGKKLSFREAVERSLMVWFLGMGAGIFFVVIITMIVANVKLSNNGITTWDKRGGFNIEHGKIGYIRSFIAILFFVAIGVLVLAQFRQAL